MIKKISGNNTADWHYYLHTALMHVNLKISKHTHISPFNAFYNRNFASTDNVEVEPLRACSEEEVLRWSEILATTTSDLIPLLSTALIDKQKKAAAYFSKSHNMVVEGDFKVGDVVFIKSQQKTKKSHAANLGPYTIVDKDLITNSVSLAQGDITHERQVPISELKKFQEFVEKSDTILEVETILQHRGTRMSPQFLLQWKNGTTSWEYGANIIDKSLINAYFVKLAS